MFCNRASVRFTPVWLARQSSTHSTSAISSARLSVSPSWKLWSPYFLAITFASSPTSSVRQAMLVSSLKYVTPEVVIHWSTAFCASSIVIVLFLVFCIHTYCYRTVVEQFHFHVRAKLTRAHFLTQCLAQRRAERLVEWDRGLMSGSPDP